MFDDCLIMAGGSGKRLWPASTSRLPKQFLPANKKMSFFSLSLERALCAGERVIVIAGNSHVNHVVSDVSKFSLSEKKRIIVIIEPTSKNTAPAIACAVKYSNFFGINRKMLVLTSDHIIKPLKQFKTDTSIAEASALSGNLVVFGISPARPETGYGYIETKNVSSRVGNVIAFHEKPDLNTAKKYYNNKKYYWNSGMFAFCLDFIMEKFYDLAPDIITPFKNLKNPKQGDYSISRGVRILKSWPGLNSVYKKTKNISFDYAIAEKCLSTTMVKSSFDWIDIGNWDDYAKISNNNNDVFKISEKSCYVNSDIPVALVGVENLIVVIRNGKDGKPAAALITRKGHTHEVRNVIELIEKSDKTEIL